MESARSAHVGARRKIVLAEVAGYCFGVRRAVEMAEGERQRRSGRLLTLGPLIHNEQVTERMNAVGIESASTLEAVDQGTVILSAHGVSPSVRMEVRERGLNVVDA